MTPIARVSAREFVSDILRQTARLTGELLVKTLIFSTQFLCVAIARCRIACPQVSEPRRRSCFFPPYGLPWPFVRHVRRKSAGACRSGIPATREPAFRSPVPAATAAPPSFTSHAREGGVRFCTDSRRPAPGLACRRGILAGIPAAPESVARRRAATANAAPPAFYVSPAVSRAREGGVRCCTDSRRPAPDLACRTARLYISRAREGGVRFCTDSRRPAPDLACRTARLYISRAREGGVRCCTDSRWPAPDLACRTARYYVSPARVGVYGVYGAGV